MVVGLPTNERIDHVHVNMFPFRLTSTKPACSGESRNFSSVFVYHEV